MIMGLLSTKEEFSEKYSRTGNRNVQKYTKSKNASTWAVGTHSVRKKREVTTTTIDNYLKLWSKAIPKIKTDFQKDFPEPPTDFDYKNTAIIHVRCGDVPFIRHALYHLYPKSYFKFVKSKLNEWGVKNIIFSFCDNHDNEKTVDKMNRKGRYEKCKSFVSTYAKWLGVDKPDIQCWDRTETWKNMYYVKALVSTMPSSFSFIPGMTKGKFFITPPSFGFKSEKTQEMAQYLSNKAPWTVWPNDDFVSHDDIADYKSLKLYQHVLV